MNDFDPIGAALDDLQPPPEQPGFFDELRRRAADEQRRTLERARVRMRVLGFVTAASLIAAIVLLVVGSPFVGRVGSDSAFAGSSLVRTVQDSTVVCTLPELHGMSAFVLSFTETYTGPYAYPSSLGVYGGALTSPSLIYILSATNRRQPRPGLLSPRQWPVQAKGVFVDRTRCGHTSVSVPLTHPGLPGPPDQLHTFTCLARGRLLIRARAIWDRRGFAASIAVRSYATRKPVAFAVINHSGSGGLYTSRGCVVNSP